MRRLAGRFFSRYEWIAGFGIAVILAAGSFPGRSAFAQDASADNGNNVRAVRLSDVEGTVQLLDNSGVVFDQAHPNMPVTEGMNLKTGSDGRAEVQFEDGSVVRITPNSSISFDQLQRAPNGDTVTQILASGGLTYYEFNNRGGTYTVRFGPYVASADKSSVFRLSLDQNPAQLAVMHGTVHVLTGNDGGQDVQTNQTATLDIKDASSYDVADKVGGDSWDQWNSDRDQQLAEMGSNATTARSLSGSPDDPGWSDLDYYGNWYDMPGYGYGWTPSGAGASFDPFGSGYWGYYPSYGYTWISNYAWGWWPYHCGAWSWFNGPGWMWFPGNCGWGAFGRGWYPVTTIWHAPPNYVSPLRPSPLAPVRGIVHMPRERALIAVSRNTGGYTPVVRPPQTVAPIRYEGKSIAPVPVSIRPKSSGPLGESFSVSSGIMPAPSYSRTIPVESGARVFNPGAIHGVPPGRGGEPSAPPRYAPPPSYHPAPSPGGGGAPHYSAPPSAPSAPHMSAPSAAPSGGGHTR